MEFDIEGPLSTIADLDQLSALHLKLYATHRAVARWGAIVTDPKMSWHRRRRLYERASNTVAPNYPLRLTLSRGAVESGG